jgi:molecular chaperone GrpE
MLCFVDLKSTKGVTMNNEKSTNNAKDNNQINSKKNTGNNVDDFHKDSKKESNKKNKEDSMTAIIDDLKNKNTELTQTVQYVQAEFENYKKRQERDYELKIKLASNDIIAKLIPILDDFDHSIAHMKKVIENETCLVEDIPKANNDIQNMINGFEMIKSNLLKTLQKEGLQEINPINEKFDPYTHEAVMQQESDKESMTILEVFQKGYKLNEKIIRHAKVKVAK